MPWFPLPVRLPFGSWWLAWNDVCGDAIFIGAFEEAERRFVEHFLQPEMTVVDVGAHHGLYTLLTSVKVGPQGRVIAFEPSPRERKKLLWHLRLNHCTNVQVESTALGSSVGQGELFVVNGRETGCNSLCPPKVSEPIKVLRVAVDTLDNYLRQQKIEGGVDFIKIDVEGAELEVFKGATVLLRREPRPVILCEVQDFRTQPWDYKAKEIIEFLHKLGYFWFSFSSDGKLEPIPVNQGVFGANLVAIPKECIDQLKTVIKGNDTEF